VLGAADELHQKFIPGRDTELLDWAADTTGGLLGAMTWAAFRSRRKDPRQT
jgi:VanZ family protein